MPLRWKRPVVIAGLIVAVVLALAADTSLAQSGKPQYKPEVEAVARSIFFELLSPY
jgi:hypothetical protein